MSVSIPPTGSTSSSQEFTALPVFLDNWYAQKKQEERLLVPQKADSATVSRIIQPTQAKEEKKQGRTAKLRLMARPGKGGKRSGSSKPVLQRLAFFNDATSAAATTLNVSIGVAPSSCGDWSAFASLFDEVRVVGSAIAWRLHTSAVTATSVDGVCVYDPIEGSALSSHSNGLVYPKHHMFCLLAGPTAQSSSPAPHTPDGYYHLSSKVYPDSVRNTTSTALTNGWMSTSDGSDIWGYWKFIVDGASAAVTVTISYYVILTCEFRSRQ